MDYKYKGRNNNGQAVVGILEADSLQAASKQLFTIGITPIDITEKKQQQDALKGIKHWVAVREIEIIDLVLFSRQMYTLLKSGVPILKAIQTLIESLEKPGLKRSLSEIYQELEAGQALSVALSQHSKIFSNLFVSIIQAGENSGKLDQSFLQIAQYLELERITRERLKTAMRYPLMVLMAISVAMVIINFFVIPAFSGVFAGFGAELPLPTRILIASSNFMMNYWGLLLVLIVGFIFGFKYYVSTEAGEYQWDKTQLSLPLIGSLLNKLYMGRFCRSFSMMMTAGLPLSNTISLVSRSIGNEYLADKVMSIRTHVERGETIGWAAKQSQLFTPLVLQMLTVGEESGQLDSMLVEVAEYYEREVNEDLKNLSSAIEPILIVFIGGVVLVLALGVFMPMWDLASVAG